MPTRGGDKFGNTKTDKFRLRPRLLFGPVLENLVVHNDGSQTWQRVQHPLELNDFNKYFDGLLFEQKTMRQSAEADCMDLNLGDIITSKNPL
jgi:hypothetical protein